MNSMSPRLPIQNQLRCSKSFDDGHEGLLSDEQYSDAQKVDFLRSMMAVKLALIDIDYGIHPIHHQIKPTIH